MTFREVLHALALGAALAVVGITLAVLLAALTACSPYG